jgi:hypothetical protein
MVITRAYTIQVLYPWYLQNKTKLVSGILFRIYFDKQSVGTRYFSKRSCKNPVTIFELIGREELKSDRK